MEEFLDGFMRGNIRDSTNANEGEWIQIPTQPVPTQNQTNNGSTQTQTADTNTNTQPPAQFAAFRSPIWNVEELINSNQIMSLNRLNQSHHNPTFSLSSNNSNTFSNFDSPEDIAEGSGILPIQSLFGSEDNQGNKNSRDNNSSVPMAMNEQREEDIPEEELEERKTDEEGHTKAEPFEIPSHNHHSLQSRHSEPNETKNSPSIVDVSFEDDENKSKKQNHADSETKEKK